MVIYYIIKIYKKLLNDFLTHQVNVTIKKSQEKNI